MRKKILISALLACGLSMSVFAVFGRRAPEPNPVKDFPVKQELEQRLQAHGPGGARNRPGNRRM